MPKRERTFPASARAPSISVRARAACHFTCRSPVACGEPLPSFDSRFHSDRSRARLLIFPIISG